MFDMFKMFGKMNEVKDRLAIAKEKLKTIIITESELDGVVTVNITAARQVKKITTSDEFYNKYSKEEREEILVEAINNALLKAEERSKEELQKELKDVMPNIPGLDLNNLPFGL